MDVGTPLNCAQMTDPGGGKGRNSGSIFFLRGILQENIVKKVN